MPAGADDGTPGGGGSIGPTRGLVFASPRSLSRGGARPPTETPVAMEATRETVASPRWSETRALGNLSAACARHSCRRRGRTVGRWNAAPDQVANAPLIIVELQPCRSRPTPTRPNCRPDRCNRRRLSRGRRSRLKIRSNRRPRHRRPKCRYRRREAGRADRRIAADAEGRTAARRLAGTEIAGEDRRKTG